MAARSEDKLMMIHYDLISQGYECIYVRTDVTKKNDCRNLVKKTIEKYGRIDILVNNAGISMRAIFQDVKLAVLESVMNVNYWGTVYCTKYALPYLLESKGALVAVSSIAGFHGLPGRTAYSASKFAIHGFMESVRIENLKKDLHVMIVSAGFTSSNIRKTALAADGTPQGESPLPENKIMKPEDVAETLIRSLRKKKRNRIISVEGQLMVFLQRILPEFVDRMIYKKFAREPNSPLK